MNNSALRGMAIRHIYFPHDVLFLSISHRRNQLVSYGDTRLEYGDQITVIGSPDSITKIAVRLEG